jgi:predicted GH43/DUF377 family glycosyl hydrolase
MYNLEVVEVKRRVSFAVVLLFVLSSLAPLAAGTVTPEAAGSRNDPTDSQDNVLAVEPRNTVGRTSTEKNSMGGSWSEYFDQATTSDQNWTQIVDGKAQLMIDPVPWTKYVNNPVLALNPAHFDSVAIRGNSILYENGIYKMWYSGYDGSNNRIGYAFSFDGKNWIRGNNGNPVMALGAPGSWDDWLLSTPWVMKVGNSYYMYYGGNDGAVARIGLATSPDGITWTKNVNNPILGTGVKFDTVHVYGCAVIKDGNTWRMWYTGNDGSGVNGDNVGYATSANGVAWNKQNNGNQVIARGAGGSFDSSSIAVPWVGRIGHRFIMYYSGFNGVDYAIGAAESFDGLTWTKLNNGNAVLNHGGGATWDSSRMLEHSIVMFDNRYYMWYAGGTTNSNTKVGLAIANSYMTSGHVQSNKILLDQGMNWDRIELKKAEPTGTTVKISVVDPVSNLPINGFDNRTESDINISTLNGLGYKSIILVAYFTGQGPSTPTLYSWGVDWVAQNTWRDSFIGGTKDKPDDNIWIRNGEAVLDADPTTWSKSASNPVLPVGGVAEWDSTMTSNPTIIFNGTEYQLYYGGYYNPLYPTGRATSNDGIGFIKDASNPVLPTSGGIDSAGAVINALLFNDDYTSEYKAWYTEWDGSQNRIGYAVSGDGRAWTKYPGTPVLDGTGGGNWDDYVSSGNGVMGPAILKINGTYYLWYAARSGASRFSIGLATSKDGVSFTKAANSQVMTASVGKFDSGNVFQPSVIYRRDKYIMFYEGDTGAWPSEVGLATSPDGTAWTKQNNNNFILNIGANGQWDSIAVGGPTVLFKDGLYRMYYHGYNGVNYQVGYAQSSYYTSESLTTEPIGPPGNAVWGRLLVNKTEPVGTSITVDVLDAASGLPVPGFQALTGTDIDVHAISAYQHPSLNLKVNLVGNGIDTPTIGDIAINWTIVNVEFKGKIPDVSFPEDTHGDKLTDLSKYFNQSVVGPTKLTYTIASNTDPTHISAIFNVDKIHIDYRSLVANWSGTAKMSIKATDNRTNAISNIYNVTVTPVNDPPTWKPIPTQWLDGNKTYVNKLDLNNYVTDIDTTINNLTFALVKNERPNNLTVAVQPKGAVNFSTKNYFSGYVNLTVSVYDKNTTVTADFMVHINWSVPPKPPFHPPVIVSQPGLFAIVGIPYVYDVNATDEDIGDVLVYMLVAYPTNMTIDPFNGLILWVPSKGQVGLQTVVVNVSDQRGMWVHQQFNIFIVAPNEPPYFTSTPVTTIRVGEKWVYEPKAKDNDSLFLFIIKAAGPPGMNIDSTGSKMDWTPTTAGKFDVVIYAWDLQAKTYQNFTITVLEPNHPPTINQIPERTIKVGESYTYKVTAQDPDTDQIMYSIKDMPVGMTIGTDGTISWKPGKQDVGTYKITVTVSDGKLNASQTFDLKVVKNEVPKTLLEAFFWPLLLLIIIIILIVVIVVVYSKKKKSDKEAEVATIAARTAPYQEGRYQAPAARTAPYQQREYPAPAVPTAQGQHNVEEVVDLDDLEEEKVPTAVTPKVPETVPKKDEPSKDIIDDILGKADNVNAGPAPKVGPTAKPGPTGQQAPMRPMKKIVKKVPQETVEKKNP